jgi:hypothetical protein
MAKEDKVWTGFKELIEKKEEEKKITGEGVNNKKLIKVFPDEVKEEMDNKGDEKEDPSLKQKQKKANMAKKQVLMKKMQAVRMGAGDQIMASKKIDGKLINEMEVDSKPKSKKEKKEGDDGTSFDAMKTLKPQEGDDPRSIPTKMNLAKNKLRAMGLNMGYEHDKGLVDAYSKVYDKQEPAENYRAMRNPKEDKPESEMSYDEKRKKRMNDPKKGINSPAFKKFMASQGM